MRCGVHVCVCESTEMFLIMLCAWSIAVAKYVAYDVKMSPEIRAQVAASWDLPHARTHTNRRT